ncbi:MAG: flagellar biosynthesis protein FliQ [Alphaproteobacteria bacterium]|jgi:flagellar biosynthetic protein FliQ|nr:flagellar biosynthesis protein FliQ [Alphaproteobacteria bacterium]MCA0451630.1 flagellar biosynthesis protein FliQ [Pseudomonadota bacterium]
MNAADVLGISREAVWVMLKIAAPLMLTALVVGLIISLFQALTQLQEQTLTFVPKILILLAVFVLTIPFMSNTLIEFTRELMAKAVGIGIGGTG